MTSVEVTSDSKDLDRLVVNKNGEREQTSEGVWNLRSRSLE